MPINRTYPKCDSSGDWVWGNERGNSKRQSRVAGKLLPVSEIGVGLRYSIRAEGRGRLVVGAIKAIMHGIAEGTGWVGGWVVGARARGYACFEC